MNNSVFLPFNFGQKSFFCEKNLSCLLFLHNYRKPWIWFPGFRFQTMMSLIAMTIDTTNVVIIQPIVLLHDALIRKLLLVQLIIWLYLCSLNFREHLLKLDWERCYCYKIAWSKRIGKYLSFCFFFSSPR